MAGEKAVSIPGDDDPVLIVVGLTAGWRKRRRARRYFAEAFGGRAWLPWIPYPLGLRASAAWLSFRLKRRIARTGAGRVHLVAYIGGGVLVRTLHARGEIWPLGRVVWDRSLAQERVARAMSERFPSVLLTIAGFRSALDLARIDLSRLTFPSCPLGAGLIVETRASALAGMLGIEAGPSDFTAEDFVALQPGVDAAIALPVSHDEVYEDPRFLDEAAAFIETGAFRAPGAVVFR